MTSTNPHPKPKALILLSSGTVLPLSAPKNHPGLSTGFFLIELAQILKEFGDEYDFTFATPDGAVPQLDINGMALAWHAVPGCGAATARAGFEQAGRFDVDRYRARRPELIARRDAELELAYRHLGRLPVSAVLPNSDKEVALLRDDLARTFQALPERTYLSARQLVERHRDPNDPFELGDFDFVHMPGGHAPMIDFVDNSWLGELLNTLHEEGVILSLICHAPVAMVSARYRVRADGAVVTSADHAFAGVRLTTVPRHGEIFALTVAYPKVPRERTRLTFFVDDALKAAGYQVRTTLNPAAVKVIWEEKAKLLTGNGPQAIDEQAARLRAVLRAG